MRETKIVVGNGSAEDYAYHIAELASKGYSRFTLHAVGENICKLADTISLIPEVFPCKVQIVGWNIGSKRVKGERKSTLTIDIIIEPLA